nr:hypothetical protein [Tanacetum cinerariifolium]
MWNDFILAHEGPSNTRDTKIAALRLKFNAFKSLEGKKVNGNFTRLKCLLNDLKNNGVSIPQAEINVTFVNSIYESVTQRFNIQASSLKALISNNHFQDSDSDVEEDQRTSNEFMADLNDEYHKRALLANQKRFYKRYGKVGSARKPLDKYKETCFTCGKLGTSNSLISLADLTLNMADLTLDTSVPKKTKPISNKVSPVYVIKKRTKNKSPAVPNKKADSPTEQLLLTLIEEVKGLKRQIKIPPGTSPSNSQSSISKYTKLKTWFGPCKHHGLRNHLNDDCYSKPKCSTCGSTNHLSKEHIQQTVVNKTLTRFKAQSYVIPSTKKAHMIPKPFKEYKYCRFNDHHSDNCEYYPGCEV